MLFVAEALPHDVMSLIFMADQLNLKNINVLLL